MVRRQWNLRRYYALMDHFRRTAPPAYVTLGAAHGYKPPAGSAAPAQTDAMDFAQFMQELAPTGYG
jgi:hypothetical protein